MGEGGGGGGGGRGREIERETSHKADVHVYNVTHITHRLICYENNMCTIFNCLYVSAICI